jgi:hypothetical protein
LKKALAVLAGLAAAGFVALAAPSPSAATTPTECPTWTLQSIVNEWGSPAEGSTVVDSHTVVLTKPVGGGTEFAAKNLNMTFDSPVSIEVEYELSDGADHAAGAVRLFYYEANSPNTLTDVPTEFIPATSGNGTLTIAGVDKIGTVGLVYDASNAAGGKVTFKNMKIGNTKIAFKDVCIEATPSATVTATPTVTASATATPSATASTTTPAPATSVSTSPAAALPVTGSSSKPWLIGLGVFVLGCALVGVAYLWRARRTFEA